MIGPIESTKDPILPEDFFEADIRVGEIIEAVPFPEARKPAIKLKIDFGPLGIKQSSAQITNRYNTDNLIKKQVIAIVNFPPRKIAGFKSEVLILGAVPEEGDVVLLGIDHKVPNGTPIA